MGIARDEHLVGFPFPSWALNPHIPNNLSLKVVRWCLCMIPNRTGKKIVSRIAKGALFFFFFFMYDEKEEERGFEIMTMRTTFLLLLVSVFLPSLTSLNVMVCCHFNRLKLLGSTCWSCSNVYRFKEKVN